MPHLPGRTLYRLIALLLTALLIPRWLAADVGLVVIAHPSVPRLDAAAISRLYTGRIVEVSGVGLTPVNARSGSVMRDRFLQLYLSQDDDHYTGYWTVRRYIGKGKPPREFGSSAEIIDFVQNTPGAVGYIFSAELRPGTAVVVIRRE